jgi:hypothetical protein
MILVFGLYFLSRLLNLLSLPIFNDESTYLLWGQIMTEGKGQAFYSLYGSKPPLMLWIWGILEKLPIDILVSGRLGTVLFGFLTLLGIIKVTQILKLETKYQITAGLLYVLNPLVLFFDRLTLFDSPVSAIFIWVLYFSLRISQSSILNLKSSIILGIIQGAGLWIKGTCQFFLFLPFVIPALTFLIDKDKIKAKKEFILFLISLVIAQILYLPMRLHPLFANFSKMEQEFLLPLNEIFQLPFWLNHLSLWSWTLFIFVTPLVLLLSLYGFLKLLKKDQKTALIMLFFLLAPLLAEIVMARFFLSRYFLFTLLPILLFASIGLQQIKKHQNIILFLVLLIPALISIFLVFDPLKTLEFISRNKTVSQDMEQYYTSWPSGYGVKPAIDWLKNEAQKGPILIITRLDNGNPENAIFAYLRNRPNIYLAQASRQPTQEELAPFKNIPIYFVSRGLQSLNMEKYLTEKIIFQKPMGEEFVGIYELKIIP